MTTIKYSDCAELARQAVYDVHNPKVLTSVIVRKLELIGELTGDKDLIVWCEFQLGQFAADLPLYRAGENGEEYAKRIVQSAPDINFAPIIHSIFARSSEAGGSFISIEMIEEVIASMQRKKIGNSGKMYLHNLLSTVSTVRNEAAKKASKLHAIFGFGDIPIQVFDTIRNRVDDLLLDICPEAVEKFMTAYHNLSSNSMEDWSMALTSCRRVIKDVADVLYPPTIQSINGRSLGEEQYVNRLWAFLDKNAISGSEKILAKAHVDYLGSFLQKLNDKACKGVHAIVRKDEAAKAVLYTYLTLGDILEYADKGVANSLKNSKGLLNINVATLKELQDAGLTTSQAKLVIRMRVQAPITSLEMLSTIKGIGPATIEKLRSTFIALPNTNKNS